MKLLIYFGVSVGLILSFYSFSIKRLNIRDIQLKLEGTYQGNKCISNSYQIVKIKNNLLFILLHSTNNNILQGKIKIDNGLFSSKVYVYFESLKSELKLEGSILDNGTILYLNKENNSNFSIQNICGSYSKQ